MLKKYNLLNFGLSSLKCSMIKELNIPFQNKQSSWDKRWKYYFTEVKKGSTFECSL